MPSPSIRSVPLPWPHTCTCSMQASAAPTTPASAKSVAATPTAPAPPSVKSECPALTHSTARVSAWPSLQPQPPCCPPLCRSATYQPGRCLKYPSLKPSPFRTPPPPRLRQRRCISGECSFDGCTAFSCWQGNTKNTCKTDGTGCAVSDQLAHWESDGQFGPMGVWAGGAHVRPALLAPPCPHACCPAPPNYLRSLAPPPSRRGALPAPATMAPTAAPPSAAMARPAARSASTALRNRVAAQQN